MGEGHPHSWLPCPFCSLPWAYLAPSLVPWTPPHVFRVSREAPAGVHHQEPSFHAPSLLPPCTLRSPRCVSTLRSGPNLSHSLCFHPRASEHGPDAEGDSSTGHGQRWAPGKGWAQGGFRGSPLFACTQGPFPSQSYGSGMRPPPNSLAGPGLPTMNM